MFRQLSDSEQELVRATLARSRLLGHAATDPAARARFLEIISSQVRLNRLRAGEVVCRAGDYGSDIYFVLEGSLREVVRDPEGLVVLPDPEMRLSAEPERRFWRRSRPREEDILVVDANVRRTIDNLDEVLARCDTTRLGEPDVAAVGTFGVLTRSAFPRTVFAETPVRLIAVHWRAVRDLMALFEPVRHAVTACCRDEIADLVRAGQFVIAALSKVPEREAVRLIEGAEFRFLRAATSGVEAVRQGEPVNEALAVVSGIGRLRHGAESRSVGFARRGDVVGLAALRAATGQGAASAVTLDFLGDTSVLAFDAAMLRELCLPYLDDDDVASSDPASVVEMGGGQPQDLSELQRRSEEAPLLDFLLDDALVRGRSAMLIDQERCVGCDACVRACADTHAGTPRFVRSGPAAAGYAVANACMHCEEAPCLVNCPTDAIFRKFSGEVLISEVLCIGCGTCAAACPYDNIRLVEMGDSPDVRERSSPVAVKCDLCLEQRGGPACVRACPHEALGRVDLASREVIGQFAGGARVGTLTSRRR